eukprot:353914-Chlamydomonas_euryale.AAC.2
MSTCTRTWRLEGGCERLACVGRPAVAASNYTWGAVWLLETWHADGTRDTVHTVTPTAHATQCTQRRRRGMLEVVLEVKLGATRGGAAPNDARRIAPHLRCHVAYRALERRRHVRLLAAQADGHPKIHDLGHDAACIGRPALEHHVGRFLRAHKARARRRGAKIGEGGVRNAGRRSGALRWPLSGCAKGGNEAR